MVCYRNAIVTKDVDLLVRLAAAAQEVLGFDDIGYPAVLDLLVEVGDDLRIFKVL